MNLIKKWWFWLIIIAIIFCSYLFLPKILYKIEPSFKEDQTEFSDFEIKRAVYSEYKVPEYFYQEEFKKGKNIYESAGYAKQWDINTSEWYHYCTNNLREAKQKAEEEINKNNEEATERTGIEKLVNSSENEKYFEFETLEISEILPPNKYYRYGKRRIFKCSYLSDLIINNLYGQKNDGDYYYKGTLAKKPITKESAREIIELLWYSGITQSGGAKVLSSSSEENADTVDHTMFITSVIYGDWGLCDQITLSKIKHSVNKETGEIKVTKREEVKTIQARCN